MQKNISTVQRMLQASLENLAGAASVEPDDDRGHDGQGNDPVMDIREELDEEGNIICQYYDKLWSFLM